MNKFTYESGDVTISKNQCDGCIYLKTDSETSCNRFESIPDEIVKNEKACPFFERIGKIKL